MHESIRKGLPDNFGIASDAPIPAPSLVSSSDTPTTNRKRKEKGYETLATAVSAIADPAYKQQQLEMMTREVVQKEKAEATFDAQEVREQGLSMEQESNRLGEYERLCELIRKNHTDLKDSSLDSDERDDLVRSNKLLIKRREKLEEKLF